jgi:hypothetical protein
VRILITISRNWNKAYRCPYEVLRTMRRQHPNAVLVHGNAMSGDRTLASFWRSLGGRTEKYPAQWKECAAECNPQHRRIGPNGEYCPTAGLRRNQQMVDTQPDLFVSFIWHNSPGATDCTERAEAAGLSIHYYTEKDE